MKEERRFASVRFLAYEPDLRVPSRRKCSATQQLFIRPNRARPMARALPLEGVRVLELGTYLAAPLATLHLAGLGASVCAVVRPDDSRGATSERGVWLRLEHPQ